MYATIAEHRAARKKKGSGALTPAALKLCLSNTDRNPTMIIDLRIYTCLPNKVADFVALYEKEGWDIQKKHLGRCYGWFTTIEGELNTIVHMWAYDDQADRERRRAAMAADPAWAAYLKKVADTGALVKMQNRIVKPTAFFEAFQAAQKG